MQQIIVFLLLLFHLSSATICYQCVTDAMLQNWSRYGMPVMQGPQEATRSCMHDENVTQTIHCDGLCVMVNVSGMIRGKSHPHMGVLRDCQRYWQQPQFLLDGEMKSCRSQIKELNRRTTVNITYCFCEGDYCNGLSRASSSLFPISDRSHRRRSQSSSHLPSILQGILIFVIISLGGGLF
ncbi:unnamed protein product, partial [Mesorhabditis belari]|uniref:Protein quiver n=1 Tax=Mesorhabditis belari TaxID=2138241 RepID=A0AAF3J7E3_9BILA